MFYLLGTNYWASNAGIEMWNNWNESAVRQDLKILSENGVGIIRMFPNWRDFQPVEAVLGYGGGIEDMCFSGGRPIDNDCMLDSTSMERFDLFCDICEEYKIKMIVGIVTGWMSGGLFIPPILLGKNLYTDPLALLLEQKFIKGLVGRFKNKKAIYAWDLGNECNCMSVAENRNAAANWTGIISHTIRAYDSERPIVSGMHSLDINDYGRKWTINDQAEFCDILTTHPYPFFVEHVYKDKMSSFRTLMHATSETKYYSGIGEKPCLVEEIGTLGPMFCDNETAAGFMRVNLFSNLANGAMGVLWWCANDQKNLKTFPYTRKNVELELGMMTTKREPKPVLKEVKRFNKLLSELDFDLPEAEIDAVCLPTRQQEQWGISYMTYCLAKQADMNIDFCNPLLKIKKADVYLMPSICGHELMPRENYLQLLEYVKAGSVLYISNNEGKVGEFEETFGIRVKDSEMEYKRVTVEYDGNYFEFINKMHLHISAEDCDVLAYNEDKEPALIMKKYGKGRIYYLNYPFEKNLLDGKNSFDGENYKLYKSLFSSIISKHDVVSDNKYIGVTLHEGENEYYCILVNYSDKKQKTMLNINEEYCVSEILYGNTSELEAYDACIFKLSKI